MTDKNSKKIIKILWAICLIPLIIGIIIVDIQIKKEVYSTDEYWVAQGYQHIYDRTSGTIVDYIEDNETCKIKNDKIIVTKHKSGYAFGLSLIFIFGMATIGCISGAITNSDWWFKHIK